MPVIDHGKIRFDLVKLLNGERVLRLTDSRTGLSLEKRLKPTEAVVRQKDRLLQVFDAALVRASTPPSRNTSTAASVWRF
jgi:hypothetical protein